MPKALIITNNVLKYLVGYSSMVDPLKKAGFEVYWAGNFKDFKGDLSDIPCQTVQANLNSNPFHPDNRIAWKQIDNFLTNNHIDLIHCNTPIGGLIGRLLGEKHSIETVIYTAHGFHFYEGNSKLKNFIFKNGEKYLAKKTDVLITINQEDYENSLSFKLKNDSNHKYLVNGVGVELPPEKEIRSFEEKSLLAQKRLNDKNIDENTLIMISVGSLNKNKNLHKVIKDLSSWPETNYRYLILGVGPEEKKLKKLVSEFGLEKRVLFLGFQTDVNFYYEMSHVLISASYREGLPRVIMEAMTYSLPCIVSNIRGNRDLIVHKKGGYLFNLEEDYIPNYLETMKNKVASMGDFNRKKVKKFEISYVNKQMLSIYKKFSTSEEYNGGEK